MNERIQELAEQADLYARSDNSSMPFENYQKRYTEKFAELIVKECAKQVNEDTSWPYDTFSEKIRQHFGVGE
jgi:hypothetical protein